jgi:peptidyl-prolyl cis-trans isomerase SurA
MRYLISKALALLATAALTLVAGGAWAQRAAPGPVVLVDRIVAVVNSEVITSGELAERVKVITQQLRQQGTPLPPAELLQ